MIFKNIFGCVSNDTVEIRKNNKQELIALSSRIDLLEINLDNRITRIEDRNAEILIMLQEIRLDIRFIREKINNKN